MTDDRHCQTLADYTSFRHIQGRKVLQIICEVPIEQASDFLAKFGVPNAHEGVPVVLSRLTKEAAEKAKHPPKEREPWNTLSCCKQAGILCGEPEFWKFLAYNYAALCGYVRRRSAACQKLSLKNNNDHAADVVRRICNVTSRRELDCPESEAMMKWTKLVREYRTYTDGLQAVDRDAAELSKPEPKGV